MLVIDNTRQIPALDKAVAAKYDKLLRIYDEDGTVLWLGYAVMTLITRDIFVAFKPGDAMTATKLIPLRRLWFQARGEWGEVTAAVERGNDRNERTARVLGFERACPLDEENDLWRS